ncbi:MAG: M23 family metallopeptidase [Pseudorhodobacter sp.]
MTALKIRGALVALLMAPAQAGAFSLDWPVDCTLGESCFIQQYPDRAPGPGALDFTCGPLSYDGHSGTDIALPDLAAMAAGVEVRAAAPGRVRAVRDGMPDIAIGQPGAPQLDRNDCGNAVVIDHAEGWETLYCHLRQGSVRVRGGDVVTAGTPLGLIGLSGQTEFPHLHMGLRRNGAEVDPFDPEGGLDCAAPPGRTLWSAPVPYEPGGLIGLGIATEVPGFDAIKAGLPAVPPLNRASAALVIWAHLYGTRTGDRLHFTLGGPDGVLLQESVVLPHTQARAMRALGKRRPPVGWPVGEYTARLTIERAGKRTEDALLHFRIGD